MSEDSDSSDDWQSDPDLETEPVYKEPDEDPIQKDS